MKPKSNFLHYINSEKELRKEVLKTLQNKESKKGTSKSRAHIHNKNEPPNKPWA